MKKIVSTGMMDYPTLRDLSAIDFPEVSFTQKKIGVLDLDDKTKFENLGNTAAAGIRIHLRRLKSCEVVEPDVLNQTLAQYGTLEEEIDPAMVSSIGTSLGIDYIIMGKIIYADVGYNYEWNNTYQHSIVIYELMMVDVKNTQIAWQGKIKGITGVFSILTALEAASEAVVKNIYPFIPLQGSIIKIENEKVYINLSRDNSIVKGDFFSLVLPKASTSKTDKEDKQFTILEIVEVDDRGCLAVLRKGEAAEIQVGVTVRKHFQTMCNYSGSCLPESEKLTWCSK